MDRPSSWLYVLVNYDMLLGHLRYEKEVYTCMYVMRAPLRLLELSLPAALLHLL